MKSNVKHALAICNGNLARLERKRIEVDIQLRRFKEEEERLDKQIAEWKKMADYLSAPLEKLDEFPDEMKIPTDFGSVLVTSLTNGIRFVLENSPNPMSAPEIRDQLMSLGFDFSKYKQELVAVHNTLKRLEGQGELQRLHMADSEARIGYATISPLERAKKEMVEIENRRKALPSKE